MMRGETAWSAVSSLCEMLIVQKEAVQSGIEREQIPLRAGATDASMPFVTALQTEMLNGVPLTEKGPHPSDMTLSNAICLSFLLDINLKRSGMSSIAMAIAESSAAAQRLRKEAEKGIRFRRSAGRVVQARRVAKGMNIDADPVLLAQQLSARPSIVSVTSEEGTYNIQAQPLPSDFGFVPPLKSPSQSSRASSITCVSTSRRSSYHAVLEPVKEVRRTALVRRRSDGSLLQPRYMNIQRRIKIYVSNDDDDM
ncbi:unnamed protein product, partial [Iphiclides podalirius]